MITIDSLREYGANVEEGLEILNNVDMNSSGKIGYHFHLADQSGASAIVEYLDNKMVVLCKEPNDVSFCLTNFTLSTKEQNGTGKERFEIMDNCLREKKSILSEKEAMMLLKDARMDGHKYYEPGHMYYDSITQWSVVYNLSKCTASVAIKSDCERIYHFEI